MLEAQVRLLVVAIPVFIQLMVPLLPLKPMAQSRRGGIWALPSALRVAKAYAFE
jgi:hypothetical protein